MDENPLQEEANRVGAEKLRPLVEQLEEDLDLKDVEGANDLLSTALIRALFEGMRLATTHVIANAQEQGVQLTAEWHLIDPDEPRARA